MAAVFLFIRQDLNRLSDQLGSPENQRFCGVKRESCLRNHWESLVILGWRGFFLMFSRFRCRRKYSGLDGFGQFFSVSRSSAGQRVYSKDLRTDHWRIPLAFLRKRVYDADTIEKQGSLCLQAERKSSNFDPLT